MHEEMANPGRNMPLVWGKQGWLRRRSIIWKHKRENAWGRYFECWIIYVNIYIYIYIMCRYIYIYNCRGQTPQHTHHITLTPNMDNMTIWKEIRKRVDGGASRRVSKLAWGEVLGRSGQSAKQEPTGLGVLGQRRRELPEFRWNQPREDKRLARIEPRKQTETRIQRSIRKSKIHRPKIYESKFTGNYPWTQEFHP